MKSKILPVLVFSICLVFSTRAQIQKGDRLFGGSFSFTIYDIRQSGPISSYNGNVGIYPSIAFAIKKNLTLGLRGSLGYSNYKVMGSQNDVRRISFTGALGIFLRKYSILKNRFGVYFDNQVSTHSSLNKEKSDLGEGKNSSWGVSYGFSPGVFYKFADNFQGEGNIGGAYVNYHQGSGGANARQWFAGVSFLQYFNLGINYIIEKEKNKD